MTEVGSAFVAIAPDARGFGRRLDGQVSGEVTKSGKRAGGLFGTSMRSGLFVAGAAVTGLIGGAVGLEAAFSKTMNVLKATTGASGKEMKDLSALALKMGADTTFSANDASKAMLELARGGMDAATIQAGALEGTLTLAAAGELDMGTAANVAVKSMGQFNLKGEDMASVAAALAGAANASSASVADMSAALAQGGLAANSVGFSIQETTGILAAFSNAGLQGSDAGTSLKTTLDRLQPTTKAQTTAMQELGVITDDGTNRFIKANGEFKSAADIAEILHQGTEKLTEAEKKRLITQAFGSDAQRGATILAKEGAKGIEKMTKATSDQNAAQKQAKANMKGTAGAIESFKGSVETATLKLGLFFAPAIQSGLGLLTDAINNVPQAFSKIKRKVGPAFDALKGAAKPVTDFIIDAFEDIRRKAKKIGDALSKVDFTNLDPKDLGKKLGEAIATALETLGSLSGKAFAALGKMLGKVDWVGLGIEIGKQVPALIVGLAAGFLTFDIGPLFTQMLDHWQVILGALLILIFAPAKFAGVLERVLTKIPFVGKFLAAAVRWLNAIGTKMKSFGKDILKSFWEGLTGRAPGATGFIAKTIGAVKALPGKFAAFFKSLGDSIGVWALDAAKAMGSGFRSGAIGFLKFVASIPGRVLSFIGNVARTLFPKGTAFVEGLLAGLRGKIGTVWGWVRAIPGKIKDFFSGALTLLTGVGGDIVAGLKSGISGAWHFVTDEVNRLINLIPAAIRKLMGISSPSKVMEQLGKWITEGLAKGISAKETVQHVLDGAKNLLDKFRDAFKTIKDEARDFASSVGGMFNDDLFNIEIAVDPVMTVIDGVTEAVEQAGVTGLAALQQTIAANTAGATAMLAALDQAKAHGLDGPLFEALAASGDLVTAQQIAQLSSAQIADLEAAYAKQQKAQQDLGALAMHEVFDQSLADAKKDRADQLKLVGHLKDKLESLPDKVKEGAESGTRAGMNDRDRNTAQRARNGR